MSDSERNKLTGSHSFFAAWMLLHEKADDWLRDAIRRANDTPEDERRDYHEFILSVDREKESLKAVFADMMVHELRRMGFVHSGDEGELRDEVQMLRDRLRGLEEKLERLGKG